MTKVNEANSFLLSDNYKKLSPLAHGVVLIGLKKKSEGDERVLQGALLDADADAFDHGVVLVLVGMVARLETRAEEFAEGLPESRPEGAEEGFQDAVAALVGLTVDELDEHLALVLGELLHLRLVLGKELFLEALEVGLLLLLGLIGVDILVGLEQRRTDEFGVGQRLLDVAHGLPVVFFLGLVAETFARIYDDGIEDDHRQRVARRGLDEVVVARKGLLQYRGQLDVVKRILHNRSRVRLSAR